MRLCSNEKVDVYEAIGDDLPALLRDAAQTLDEIAGHQGYMWADLKVGTHFGDDQFDGDLSLTMHVH